MESNQPPTTYQIVMLPLQHRTAVGKVGVEPTLSCSHDHEYMVPGGPPLPYLPKSYAAPSSSYGSRTHLTGLKARYPAPIDERAAYCFRQWVGRRLRFCYRPALGCRPGSRARLLLLGFNQALNRLSYQPEFLSTSMKKGLVSL